MSLPSPEYLWALLPLTILGLGLLVHKPMSGRWPTLSVWLRRRTWPKPLRVLHVTLLFSFITLLLSGVAIYVPAIHADLLPWSQALYAIHVWLGSAFGFTLVTVLIWPEGWLRRVRLLDWMLLSAAVIALSLSGYVLWFVSVFPATWNLSAFGMHGWVAYGLMLWLLIHALLRTFSFQRPDHLLNVRIDFKRRRFLGAGLSLSAAVVGFMGLSGWRKNYSLALSRSDSMATSDAAAQWAFPEHYSYTGSFPQIDQTAYRLSIIGLVTRPVTRRLDEIRHLPSKRIRETFHCVTGWSVPDVPWDGVALDVLLAPAKLLPEARYLAFYSADGVYVDCLSLELLKAHDAFLAYGIAGEALSPEGGFPLRLVVPGMYGYKSVKWVDKVVATAKPIQGTWERQGYPANAYLGSVNTGL